MSLLRFPPELLLQVGDELDPNPLNALIRSNHLLNELLRPRLESLAFLPKDNMPAICWAAKRGHSLLIYNLIKERVDVNAQDPVAKETALHKAARGGFITISKLLLESGTGINKRNLQGNTALHIAAARGHTHVVELLLAKRADYTLLNGNGESVFYVAAKGGSEAVVKLLLECMDKTVWRATAYNDTALHAAIRAGHERVARLLIEMGFCDCKRELKFNWITRSWSAATNIDELGPGMTVLHEAVRSGLDAIIELLLRKGADINAKGSWEDKNGLGYGQRVFRVRPLHLAMTNKDIPVVELLLKNGADINLTDWCGRTPIHWAVAYRFDQAITLLIEKGANTRAKDHNGRKPLDGYYYWSWYVCNDFARRMAL